MASHKNFGQSKIRGSGQRLDFTKWEIQETSHTSAVGENPQI